MSAAPPAYSAPSNGAPAPREYLGSMVIEGRIPLRTSSWDPQKDIQAIYKATHGMGTRDVKLIKALLGKSSAQAQVLEVAYENHTHKNLIARIIDETSDDYQTGLIMLAKGAVGGDAYLLSKIGSIEREERLAILTDIIIGRTKDEIAILKGFIRSRQQSDLRTIVMDALPAKQPILSDVFEQALKVESKLVDGVLGSEDYTVLTRLMEDHNRRTYTAAVLSRILDRPANHLAYVDSLWRETQFNSSYAQSIATYFSDKPEVAQALRYAIEAGETQDGKFDYGVWRDAMRIDEAILKRQWLVVTVRLVRAHWDKRRFKQIVGVVDSVRQGKDGSLLERLKGAKKSLLSPVGASNELVSLWKEMIREGTA